MGFHRIANENGKLTSTISHEYLYRRTFTLRAHSKLIGKTIFKFASLRVGVEQLRKHQRDFLAVKHNPV